jgi:hypothetical protein
MRYPVVSKNVVDFHDVDLISNAARVAIPNTAISPALYHKQLMIVLVV